MNSDERLITAFVTLECELWSSPEDVRASYHQLVKVWHPDRFQGDEKLKIKATDKMKAINNAYHLLESLFEEVERLNCANETNSTCESTGSENPVSKAQPESPRFEIGSETTFVIENKLPKAGNKVFEQRVEKIISYDGRWVTKATTITRTRPVDLDVSFERAAANSISFLPPDEQGSPTTKIRSTGTLEGLRRTSVTLGEPSMVERSEHESENGGGSGFSDESLIEEITIHTDTWFHDDEKKATSGRKSSKLTELQEAYEVYELRRDWHSCFEISQRTVELHRQEAWGWFKRSEALRNAGLEQDAYRALIPAADLFVEQAEIPYTLARYATRLGDLHSAKNWLHRTFDVAALQGPNCLFERYQDLARREPDLSPIENYIPNKPLSWTVRKFFGV